MWKLPAIIHGSIIFPYSSPSHSCQIFPFLLSSFSHNFPPQHITSLWYGFPKKLYNFTNMHEKTNIYQVLSRCWISKCFTCVVSIDLHKNSCALDFISSILPAGKFESKRLSFQSLQTCKTWEFKLKQKLKSKISFFFHLYPNIFYSAPSYSIF